MARRLRSAIALALLVALAGAGCATTPGTKGGWGAHPLNDRVAAAWFIRDTNPPRTYEMAAIVFMVGEPGWTARRTEFSVQIQQPAYAEFKFEGLPFRIDLDLAASQLGIVGRNIGLADANVVVVAGANTPQPRIVYQEKLDLVLPYEGDLGDRLRALLARSRPLRQVLGFESKPPSP